MVKLQHPVSTIASLSSGKDLGMGQLFSSEGQAPVSQSFSSTFLKPQGFCRRATEFFLGKFHLPRGEAPSGLVTAQPHSTIQTGLSPQGPAGLPSYHIQAGILRVATPTPAPAKAGFVAEWGRVEAGDTEE